MGSRSTLSFSKAAHHGQRWTGSAQGPPGTPCHHAGHTTLPRHATLPHAAQTPGPDFALTPCKEGDTLFLCLPQPCLLGLSPQPLRHLQAVEEAERARSSEGTGDMVAGLTSRGHRLESKAWHVAAAEFLQARWARSTASH